MSSSFAVSVVFHCSFGLVACAINSSTGGHTNDEDYYVNYDYDLGGSSNDSELFRGKSESLIFPNPETLDAKYPVDVLPKVELPDDSLADTDLRDHDFIDNLMYVYYGSHSKQENNYGPEIIIVGSVLSCAAQLLTIFVALLRRNPNGAGDVNLIFLHLMGCLCLSNLLFMLGVYATKSVIKCQIIAVTLHYLHLLIACWLFLYTYYIYKRFHNLDVPKLHYVFTYGYGLPALLTLVAFVVAPRSYETKRFCFVSVQKGMMVNYMLPVSSLIVLTTAFALNGLRKINLELSKLELFTISAESLNVLKNEAEQVEAQRKNADSEVISLKECKYCLKALCIVQTSYDMVWFVAVLALENIRYSNSMSIVYSITSCLLNWYIFARRKSFLPTLSNKVNCTDECGAHATDRNVNKVASPKNAPLNRGESSDSIPLLINSETCTEMHEIRSDYISTISS